MAVAYEFMAEGSVEAWLEVLADHPRYREDFLEQMPAAVLRDGEQARQRWLLGQAAVWPDLARGLPEAQRRRYNRPDWHWLDGSWVRGNFQRQGDVHVGVTPGAPTGGRHLTASASESEVSNLMLALDYNLALLNDTSTRPEERALALCWVLHLAGDIHQPLHTGALVSSDLFPNGDRGGNGIRTDRGSLHASWDQVLRGGRFSESLTELLKLATESTALERRATVMNRASWLAESRNILRDLVYTEEMRRAVLEAERTGNDLPRFTLSEGYVGRMRQIAERQISLAGRRIATILNSPATVAPN